MERAKHVVITGASSGIGAALTRALAQDGYRLYVCARRQDRLKGTTSNGTVAFDYQCDVSKEEQVAEFAAQIRRLTEHIDVLINCAAIQGEIGSIVGTNSGDWRKTIETNLFGTYYMVKHIIPLMPSQSGARILNFAGGGAFNAFPNYSAYAVSKAAIVRLTENLAVELAPKGITVNALAPGFVATEIHEQTLKAGPERAGREYYEFTVQKMADGSIPIEIPVNCVRFLLSSSAHGLTGKVISASFDPWSSPIFQQRIDDINKSDLYTMRRINLVNLPEGSLKQDMTAASEKT